MKKIIWVLLISFSCKLAHSQINRSIQTTRPPLWTWEGGDKYEYNYGSYSTKGVPDADNIPGARYGAVSWKGKDGQIWIMGGQGLAVAANPNKIGSVGGSLNDLWSYNPQTGYWTWQSGDSIANEYGNWGTKGVAAVTNMPPSREGAAAWTGSDGRLWLFGGFGYYQEKNFAVVEFNDLWSYDPASKLWTWESGDSSFPKLCESIHEARGVASPNNQPACGNGAYWTGSDGLLWLMTGNDLWSFDTQTKYWTWHGGESIFGGLGNYGTIGLASPSNWPSARFYASTWTDRDGKLWLFGGQGNNGYLNDMWSYDPQTTNWTWQSGDTIPTQLGSLGSYGTKGVAALTNKPRVRWGASTWTAKDGQLWLYGGGSNNDYLELNDLWSFNPQTKIWTWQSGDSLPGPNANLNLNKEIGIYGSKGVPDSSNKIGSRAFAVQWVGDDGKLFLWGGVGAEIWQMFHNELWSYDPTTTYWTWESGPKNVYRIGEYGKRNFPDTLNWPGGRSKAAAWTSKDGKLWLMGGGGFDNGEDYIANSGLLNDLWSYDPQTALWTWQGGDSIRNQRAIRGVKGIAAAVNKPGAFSSAHYWTGTDGRFWLMPGNELWNYDPQTQFWTWQGGDSLVDKAGIYGTKGVAAATNKPRSRLDAATWVSDDGHLWLMGGNYSDTVINNRVNINYFNDLWSYDPQTGYWTWQGGDSIPNQGGIRGVKGITSANNKPGAFSNAHYWTGTDGRFWLMRGTELWSYDPQSTYWTWHGGDTIPSVVGVYGIVGVEDSTNKPRAVQDALTWTGPDGRLWFWGGLYTETKILPGQIWPTTLYRYCNDLWSYNPQTGFWTWQGGDSIPNQFANYGKKRIPAASNSPGKRTKSSMTWTAPDGVFWMFGGSYNDDYNDLWSLDVYGYRNNKIQVGTLTSNSFCAGSTLDIPYFVSGKFDPGNSFTAQLSDANGNFNNSYTLGTLQAIGSGTIKGRLPSNLPVGTGYKIRVLGSQPTTFTYDTSSAFSIVESIAITNSPQSLSITYGNSASFSVTAGGSNLNYQWQSLSTTAGSVWTPITNATASTLNFTKPSVLQNGWQYRCLVNGSCGSPLFSSPATISVDPAALNFSGTRLYNGSATVSSSELAVSGILSGDNARVVGSATLSSAEAGTYTEFATNSLLVSNPNYSTIGGTLNFVITTIPDLQLLAAPNPAAYSFQLKAESNDPVLPIKVLIKDLSGHIIEDLGIITPGVYFDVGRKYLSGFYIAEAIQGKNRTIIKLIKGK